jgi:hypothetical protein
MLDCTLCRETPALVSVLFANLEGGGGVAGDDFLEWLTGLLREQVNLVLEHAALSRGRGVVVAAMTAVYSTVIDKSKLATQRK